MIKRKKIEAKIKKALEEQDTYTSALDFVIASCACSYCVMVAAYDEMEKADGVTIVEMSREMNEIKKANPAAKIMFDANEATRKSLRELGLTLSTLASSEDDEVNDLLSAVNEAKQ